MYAKYAFADLARLVTESGSYTRDIIGYNFMKSFMKKIDNRFVPGCVVGRQRQMQPSTEEIRRVLSA
jgi:hypothetical protein